MAEYSDFQLRIQFGRKITDNAIFRTALYKSLWKCSNFTQKLKTTVSK